VTHGEGGDGLREGFDLGAAHNLALSARINHALRDAIGYVEGAPRHAACRTHAEVGAWAYYQADSAAPAPADGTDALRLGVDVAAGRGGFSFTGAATWGRDENGAGREAGYSAYLLQLGYRLPRTRWEVAARWSRYAVDNAGGAFAPLAGQQQPLGDGAVSEIALALNHYFKGHRHKLGLDLAFAWGDDPGSTLLFDRYTGHPGSVGATGAGDADYGWMLRLQWQLAL
jgi:hypothetical protein